MGLAAKWDICIDQGATWTKEIAFTDANNAPVDVSAWTWQGQIRAYADAPAVLATFVFSPGSATNKIYVSLSAAVTAALPVPPSGKSPVRKVAVYIYDMEADQGAGVIERIFQGSASVSAEVTKE